MCLQIHDDTTGKLNITLRSNQNRAKYCGHVFYKPSFELGRKESERAVFCVTSQSKNIFSCSHT